MAKKQGTLVTEINNIFEIRKTDHVYSVWQRYYSENGRLQRKILIPEIESLEEAMQRCQTMINIAYNYMMSK